MEPVPPVNESVLTITWKFFMDEADNLKKNNAEFRRNDGK